MAAAASTLFVAWAIIDPPGSSSGWPTWSAWPVAAMVSLPVAIRRRRPGLALSIAGAAAVLATMAGAVPAGAVSVAFFPVALVLYLFASTVPVSRAAAVLAVCVAGAVAAVLTFYAQVLPTLPPAPAPSEFPALWPVETGLIVLSLTACWVAGATVRWKRHMSARLARHLADAAVADERRRIARELHDVIGHSMSLIAIKATVANHVADTHPQEVRAAMAVIEQTSQSTLTEIRRVLGLLRSDGDDPDDTLVPVPGMDDLPGLVHQARSAGLDTELTMRGEAALPPAVALTAYRIVQEALTNAVTHAAPTRCSVTVEIDAGQVSIEVVDSGPEAHREPRRTGLGGHGLIGMRERAAMFEGTFSAGPRPGGGFQVSARLPYSPVGTSA